MYQFEKYDDFETFAAGAYGLTPEALRQTEMLYANQDITSVVATWARAQSESARVDAITAKGRNAAMESLGRWKALQEFADFLTVRMADFTSMRQEWVTIQSAQNQ